MPCERFISNWQGFQQEARQQWMDLTESDWQSCQGDRNKLLYKLQQVYGLTLHEADRQIMIVERRMAMQ